MKKEFKRKIFLTSLFLTIIIKDIITKNSIKSNSEEKYKENEENRIIRIKELNLDSKETYIPVKSGHTFTIELEGNPTTGYSWFLETPEKIEKEGLLIPKNLDKNNSGEYYRSTENNKDTNNTEIKRLGSGGIYHFKFLAGEKNGHEEITFIYKRSWEESNTNQIKKTINVKVVNINKQTEL